MTYQNLTLEHDDNAEEVSPLLLTVAGGGVPAGKKKNGVPTMRAMLVTTCFLLGTLTVIYGGRISSSNTVNLGAALLDDVYDPNSDYCYKDKDHADRYCWYPTDEFPCTEQNYWVLDGNHYHGYNDCGPECITY